MTSYHDRVVWIVYCGLAQVLVLVVMGGCSPSLTTLVREHNTLALASELDKGTSSDERENGVTPLLLATELGYVDVVDTLLAHGADPNQMKILEPPYHKSEGETPLIVACRNGNTEIVQALINAGANVEVCCIRRHELSPSTQQLFQVRIPIAIEGTPLAVAAVNRHIDVVKMLLTAGANPNAQYHYGNETVYEGGESSSGERVQITTGVGVKGTALHLAARTGDTELGTLLLNSQYIIVDSRDGKGLTPLMVAAYKGHLEFVQLLLEYGADPALKSSAGTSMDLARKGGHADIVTLLESVSQPID